MAYETLEDVARRVLVHVSRLAGMKDVLTRALESLKLNLDTKF